MSENIKWGPAIAVDGKRPEFVRDEDTILPKWPEWSIWKMGVSVWRVSAEQWVDTVALKLPADHPHYRQPEKVTGGDLKVGDAHVKPTPQADTKPDVTARMENLVHLVADGALRDDMIREEAQAIKALLRGPEDPDLIEAREIMQAKFYCNDPEWQGDLDTTRAYKLIKRGRELALAGETGK